MGSVGRQALISTAVTDAVKALCTARRPHADQYRERGRCRIEAGDSTRRRSTGTDYQAALTCLVDTREQALRHRRQVKFQLCATAGPLWVKSGSKNPFTSMSALPPKADICSATRMSAIKADMTALIQAP